jgi:hypothetical protein
MFKKFFALAILGSLFCAGAQAQSFMHAAGATVSIMSAKYETPYGDEKFLITKSGLTYFPRFNFVEGENSSVSVGIPFTAGLSIARNTNSLYDDETGLSWSLDFPLVVDYNIGAKSTADNPASVGGYIGTGFSYSFTSIKFDESETIKANSYGPLFRGGMRFGFNAQNLDLGLTVGLFYKIGLEDEKFKTFGFNVLVDF